MTEDEVLALLQECSNLGRWGDEDELGTLNYITPLVRRGAAALVRLGLPVSLGKDLDTTQSVINARPAWHVMHLETERPYASADSLHLQVHGLATTHLDAISHMFHDGVGYNGRRQSEVVGGDGVHAASIHAQREGIFTRGVLLDVAAAAGVPWLEPTEAVTPELLEAAERRTGEQLRSGDALVVHTGLERRESAIGPEDPFRRAGLDAACLPWLHRREVAVYSGDCIEQLPQPFARIPLPLHQVGLAAMGLILLDCPSLTELVETCTRVARTTFLLTAAPLRVRGGTGSPVNPIALF